MGVDIADAAPVEGCAIDQVKHFPVRSAGGLRQPLQDAENVVALPQIAECHLADDEWMPEDLAVIEQRAEDRTSQPQMVDQTDVSTRIT